MGLWKFRVLESSSSTSYVTTVLGWYIANPALAGGFLGALFFAALAIIECNRVEKNHVDSILYAIISPLKAAKVRFFSLLAAATMVQLITMLIWLPFTMIKTGHVFDFENYIFMYILFMYAEIVTGLLFAITAFQLTKRADMSFILLVIFVALGLTVFHDNWLLSWALPLVWAVSDDFTNHRIFMSIAYMGLFWILVLSGSCFLSYLCIRHYNKNIFASFVYHLRRVPAFVLAMVLLAGGVYTYRNQPFLDKSTNNVDYEAYSNFQIKESIFCDRITVDVRPNVKTGCIYGTETCKMENRSGKEQKVTFYLTPGYKFQKVTANDKEIPFHINDDDTINTCTAEITLPADKEIELRMEYGGFPRYWGSMFSMQGDPEISEKYMCLERECLAPSPRDPNWDYENGEFIVNITVPDKLKTIPFGPEKAKVIKENADGTKVWQVRQKHSNTANLFIGDYICEPFDVAGIHVEFYYGRKHKEIMEKAKAVEGIKAVMEYCTEHIGPLVFLDDNTIKLIEKRIAGGGYAGNGSSTLDELDYTEMNLSNSAKGSIPGEIIIHETVHQWWGLGNMFDWDDRAADIWSSEGLTVYTSYRIVKELYGEDYAKKTYVDKWKECMKGYYDNFYIRHPEYLKCLPQRYQDQIAGSLDEIRKYDEMPLKILKAEKLVGGAEKMDKILHDIFTREMNEDNQYLTYAMFLDACGLSEEDLNLE